MSTINDGPIPFAADMTHPPQPEANELKRILGPFQLVALGIGAIIGAGIFVMTGHAAASFAGPGVIVSFAIAGLGCLFAGLCYAEYASMIPVAGSAYTYAYATLGRPVAWFIGWNLVLEYLATAATVAVGWSAYFGDFMRSIGLPLPATIASAPIAVRGVHDFVLTGTVINLPAMLLVGIVSILLVIGVHLSAKLNIAMVAIKLAIVLLVIAFGLPHVSHANLVPFVPENTGTFGQFGWSGVFRATGVIFFAYIGFDAVSVAAQEARNPQRDLPIGILGSLVICTGLYMAMSFVLTGIAPYGTLNVPHPVSMAVESMPSTAWLGPLVNLGAIVGLASVVLVMLLGQSRIFYAMAKDGLFFEVFGRIHPKFRTPTTGTLITGLFAAIAAGVLPLDILGELVSIGTLAAFVVVCLGVMVLRVTRPQARRPFRTPAVWIIAPLGVATCLFMMAFLPLDTWFRLAVWTLIGFGIYFAYGVRHACPPRWRLEEDPARGILSSNPLPGNAPAK
jgi:APA family basic amino acid/polyamine antiporter